MDALRPAWLAVPLVLTAGVLYDNTSLNEALRLLPPTDPEHLVTAGRAGLDDPALRRCAEELFALALDGAERLGERRIGGRALETARAFRERFLALGEDPGSERDDLDPFEI